MAHTPYGYRIEEGKAILDEEEAVAFHRMIGYYLGGMGREEAAKKAGIKANHTQVKNMFLNKKYLGTDHYPPLMTKEEMDEVRKEMDKRVQAMGRIRGPKEKKDAEPVPVAFVMKKADTGYSDPYEHARYLYSLIEEAGKNG